MLGRGVGPRRREWRQPRDRLLEPRAVAPFGGKTRTLEGGWTPPRVVVLEFPTYEAAEKFYDSPEYKPVLEMRLKAGKSEAILVDGHSG